MLPLTPRVQKLERATRIELVRKPWQGFRLPLHHARNKLVEDGGDGGNRTLKCALQRRQFPVSLRPLTPFTSDSLFY